MTSGCLTEQVLERVLGLLAGQCRPMAPPSGQQPDTRRGQSGQGEGEQGKPQKECHGGKGDFDYTKLNYSFSRKVNHMSREIC